MILTISYELLIKIVIGICILAIIVISPQAYHEFSTAYQYQDVAAYLFYSENPFLGKVHNAEKCELCKNNEKYLELYEKHLKILKENNITVINNFSNDYFNMNIRVE